jgi:hypothetical protein
MIDDPRPVGIVLALAGVAGIAISALADPLGIGEGNVFGWLQITGVIIGAVVTLLALALTMDWIPIARRGTPPPASSSQNTTIIED